MNRTAPLLFALLLASLAAACSDDDPGVNGDAGPASDVLAAPDAFVAPFDPTVCGAKKHAWLPPGSMGKLLDSKWIQTFSLSKDALKTMLTLTDYKDIVQVEYGVQVYFFRYETQDRGKKVEATAALAFPDPSDGKPLKDLPTMLWLHGTSGFSDKCAPTYKIADAAAPAALMASQGYIAVAPDFIGMNGFGAASTVPHPYVVAESTAIASLDALRAGHALVKQEAKLVTAGKKFVPWGPSQGGHATLSTVTYASHYAPEFELVAAVPLIAPVDIKGQAQAALSAFSGSTAILAGIIMAQARWYGHEDKVKDVFVDKWVTELPKLMDSSCSFNEKKRGVTAVTDLYKQKFIDAVVKNDYTGFDTVGCMLNGNSMTSTSVKVDKGAPMFFVVGENDELVDAASQRKSFDAMCKAGYKMNYLECKGANHVAGALWSLPEQFAWVKDRLAGKAMTDMCKRPAAACCKASDKAPCK